MAAGGGSSPKCHEDRVHSLTCSLCLNIFTQPKFLPCHHTFCMKCLEDLTSRLKSSTFPCPHCRSETAVPAGGVAAFQSNFYIHPEDTDRAAEGTHCLTHPDQKLDLFCTDCQLIVCLKCVVTDHRQHNTKTLSEAAKDAWAQLSQDEHRLQKAVACMTQQVKAEKAEQEALLGKKEAVKTVIRNKHATVVALAEKYRDELLTSVDTTCGQMEKDVNTALGIKANDLRDLCQLQQRLEETLTSGPASTQVIMAKEMRDGKGSAQTVENIVSSRRIFISRPVLNSSLTFDTMKQKVQDFFGTADTMEMRVAPDEVVVQERFTCRKEQDTEVFCLCPQDNGTVLVSYANCGLQNNVANEKFTYSGKLHRDSVKHSGKVSHKCTGDGRSIVNKKSNSFVTFCKAIDTSNKHLKLSNNLQGKADVETTIIKSKDPIKVQNVKEFNINVGPHRAVDVDTSEKFFVVVEEPQEPDQQRKVRLYQRNKPDATATYTSPSKPFNPSDVCFFILGSMEVLTIADEAGDSIHVVHVQDGSLTFVRHLVPGCPVLVQPTALNIDDRGRLWVACRGGKVLTISPLML